MFFVKAIPRALFVRIGAVGKTIATSVEFRRPSSVRSQSVDELENERRHGSSALAVECTVEVVQVVDG